MNNRTDIITDTLRYFPLPALFIFLSLYSLKSFTQEPIEIEEIKVIAPYVPTISDAYKINENPVNDDTLKVEMDFEYNIMPKRIDTRFEVEPITAARMRGEPLDKLYRGLVKAGYGSYNTPYVEAFYNSLRSDRHLLGVHAKHISSTGEIQDYEFSSFSENKIDLFGQRFFRNHTLDANLGFNRDVVHYYGFSRDDFTGNQVILDFIDQLSKEDLRQHYNKLSGGIGFGTHHADSSRTSYHSDLKYYWLSDRYDASEHNIRFSANVARKIPYDPSGFGFSHFFDIKADVDYYNTNIPSATLNAAVVSLKPMIYSQGSKLRFHLGLDASVQADTTSYFRVYPQAGVQFDIVPDVFLAYAQLSGGLKRHSVGSLSEVNPFINTNMQYSFMNTRTEISGGIKGSLTDYISYNFSLQNSKIDNFPFFVTDTTTTLNNQFIAVYDEVRRFNLRGEIFSQINERLMTRIRADYYQYSQEQQAEPWHMPSMEIGLNIKYNIQNKIILTADAFARDSVYGLKYDEQGNQEAHKIHGFHVDINAGIEYRYTSILGIFLNFNNLQNQSLERWINYPSQRFNIIGGLSYSF